MARFSFLPREASLRDAGNENRSGPWAGFALA